jgi:cell filamentation protein
MYEVEDDLYCYPGTRVLKNIPGIRDQQALDAYEVAITTQRADEPLPMGRLGVRHYCAVHRHLFQDVYPWAGKFRRIRIEKGGSMFCYPENIAREVAILFADLKAQNFLRGLPRRRFARAAARFLATLNAIHAFRDGNGRAQVSFVALLAHRAGRPLDLTALDPDAFLAAMIESFNGSEASLERQLESLIVDA